MHIHLLHTYSTNRHTLTSYITQKHVPLLNVGMNTCTLTSYRDMGTHMHIHDLHTCTHRGMHIYAHSLTGKHIDSLPTCTQTHYTNLHR